jgi:hypothetical protein
VAMSQIAMVEFIDADSSDQAVVLVRAKEGLISVAISLRQNGDLEVFFGKAECERVIDALQKALAIAQGHPTRARNPVEQAPA